MENLKLILLTAGIVHNLLGQTSKGLQNTRKTLSLANYLIHGCHVVIGFLFAIIILDFRNNEQLQHLQIALGRRFRSLKIWFVLRNLGVERIQQYQRRVLFFTAIYLRKRRKPGLRYKKYKELRFALKLAKGILAKHDCKFFFPLLQSMIIYQFRRLK